MSCFCLESYAGAAEEMGWSIGSVGSRRGGGGRRTKIDRGEGRCFDGPFFVGTFNYNLPGLFFTPCSNWFLFCSIPSKSWISTRASRRRRTSQVGDCFVLSLFKTFHSRWIFCIIFSHKFFHWISCFFRLDIICCHKIASKVRRHQTEWRWTVFRKKSRVVLFLIWP